MFYHFHIFGTDFGHMAYITGINNDCMRSIFEYLEYNDLLNVAEASKELYPAVCEVFERKYKKRKLCFGSEGNFR